MPGVPAQCRVDKALVGLGELQDFLVGRIVGADSDYGDNIGRPGIGQDWLKVVNFFQVGMGVNKLCHRSATWRDNYIIISYPRRRVNC
ncbi:hypothetical protein ES703_36798 [subsurface metagenome]